MGRGVHSCSSQERCKGWSLEGEAGPQSCTNTPHGPPSLYIIFNQNSLFNQQTLSQIPGLQSVPSLQVNPLEITKCTPSNVLSAKKPNNKQLC